LRLVSAGRNLDPTEIFGLKIYLSQPAVAASLEIDNLRLE
jgi:hypothetical protein